MSMQTQMTLENIADRVAIRDLIDAYAHHADSREPEKQCDLYMRDGRTLVHMGTTESTPLILSTRDEHLEGFRGLSQYAATTHFNGQSTISLNGDTAAAETYCLAHHILETADGRSLSIMSIRYEDQFIRTSEGWRFSERTLVITWTDTRPSQP